MISTTAATELVEAARSKARVEGLTHNFYRYPARLSPVFASAAIRALCPAGGTVLDPFMGGGTVVVEALASGRKAIGCDINSLSLFITRAKTTPLTRRESEEIEAWAVNVVPSLIGKGNEVAADHLEDSRASNLRRAGVHWLSLLLAAGKESASRLSTPASRAFAQCVLLSAGQWCLNGRRRETTTAELRSRITETALEMLEGASAYRSVLRGEGSLARRPKLFATSSENLTAKHLPDGQLVDLVVTSPPYPGIHVLYHRWQVDGRKESAAPYWLTECHDGQPASYYNMGPRKQEGHASYFGSIERCFSAVRRVLSATAHVVQLVSFSEPEWMVGRYLEAMRSAGLAEVSLAGVDADSGADSRVWRDVPGRAWHATMRNVSPASRELLLVHRRA
jgi:hypothetical protein